MAKYKLKTHKGTQKRIGTTGSGKLTRGKGHQSHLRRKKPKDVKRLYGEQLPVSESDKDRLRKLLPYGVS
jgi:large subunit ribosomal protein L35